MEAQQLQELAMRLAAFADLMEQRAERAVSAGEQQAKQVAAAAQHMSGQARELAHNVVQAVRQDTRGAIQQGVDEGMRQGAEQLRGFVSEAVQAARTLDTQVIALRQAQQSLVWKSGMALMLGAVLAMTATALYGWQTVSRVRNARFPAQILQASKNGTLSQCDGKLCVRVGAQPKRFGKNGEYVQVAD